MANFLQKGFKGYLSDFHHTMKGSKGLYCKCLVKRTPIHSWIQG